MGKYQFDPAVRSSLENAPVPLAVYQFIDRRVVTLILSKGFLDLFGFEDREEAYFVMDNDMYRSTHPDDMSRSALPPRAGNITSSTVPGRKTTAGLP